MNNILLLFNTQILHQSLYIKVHPLHTLGYRIVNNADSQITRMPEFGTNRFIWDLSLPPLDLYRFR